MSRRIKSFIFSLLTRATIEQSRDTGQATVLLCLLAVYFWNYQQLIPLTVLLLLGTMVWPGLFRPLAGLWFASANFMGAMISCVLLAILFFGIVMPIGLIRQLLGADPLQITKWKRGAESVFIQRDALIIPENLEKPY